MIKGLRLTNGQSEESSRHLVCLEETGAHKQRVCWEASLAPRDELLKPNVGLGTLPNKKVH